MYRSAASTELSGNEFFRGWPPAAVSELAAHALGLRAQPGRVLFAKGDTGTAAYLVLEGSVRIWAPSADGREVTIAMLGPGEILGEIAMLDCRQRTATAVAADRCRLLAFERRAMLETIRRHPEVALRLIEVLCARLRRTTSQVEEMSFLPLPARLARALCRLGAAQGADLAAGQAILVTQRQLGEAITLSREGTNRILRAWQDRGVIRLGKGRVSVRDHAALQRIAADTEAAGSSGY